MTQAMTEEAPRDASVGGEGRARRPRPATFRFNAHVFVLTLLMTAVFLMFVLVEPTPRWVLALGAIVAALGTEGTLRASWPQSFRGPRPVDPTQALFMPALFAVAAPLVVEHNADGYLALAGALASGGCFALVLMAAIGSLRTRAPRFALARVIATSATYFTAFTLFGFTYVFALDLPAALAAVGIVALMLAIEVLREGQVDAVETTVLAAVTAIALAETRWALYYIAIDGYLAGLVLALVLFVITGLLHAYQVRALDATTVAEYALIGGAGMALVVAARAAGLA